METQKKDASRKRRGKEVSFDFKLSVIDEIKNGRISANYASKKYNMRPLQNSNITKPSLF